VSWQREQVNFAKERQCILHGAPFKVEIPKFNAETPAAMEDFKKAYSVWLKRGIDD